MRVLLIGCSGYVGPSVMRELRARHANWHLAGIDVGWFAHQVDGGGPLPEASLDRFTMRDVRDLALEDLSGVDAVVYLAAISNDPMGNRFERQTLEINQRQAVRVANLAKEAQARHFVFASSASVYGRGDGDRSEIDVLDPQTTYARSKIGTEIELRELADQGYSITCLRFATACGWSPRVRLDLVLNDFVATGLTKKSIEVLSDGSPWRPLIHVDDMARAVDWTFTPFRAEQAPFIAVNVGSPEWNFQIRDLALSVSHALGGVTVTVNADATPDTRSYRLDFSLWQRIAPEHQPHITIHGAIDQLANRLSELPDLRDDFRTSRRMRLRQLETWMAAGYLDEDLRWTR